MAGSVRVRRSGNRERLRGEPFGGGGVSAGGKPLAGSDRDGEMDERTVYGPSGGRWLETSDLIHAAHTSCEILVIVD